MTREDLLEKVGRVFEREPRMIRLPVEGKVVFVGDTHGDLDASQQVIQRYLKKPYRIVFLGDYVDRGDYSEENIRYLLEMKLMYPDQLFLLAGNHEGYLVKAFYPANFWEALSSEKKKGYGLLFSKFPLATVTQSGILALHGGLPDLESLEDLNQIEWGDAHWNKVVWGDFVESEIDVLKDWGGRPQFGQPYFNRIMDRYQKQVLIRSHQPYAPSIMFHKRCITIFTSYVYLPIRTIAIADMEKETRTTEDLCLERI
jgi:predicted phosphodiesterase